MRAKRSQSDVEEFFARKLVRVGMPVGSVCMLINAGLSASQLAANDLRLHNWFGVVSGVLVSGWLGWFSASSWRHPLVRITATEIEVGYIGSRSRRRVRLEELVGLRWQDSFDLRLCTRSGTEYSVHFSQFALGDRGPLETVLRERIRSCQPRHLTTA